MRYSAEIGDATIMHGFIGMTVFVKQSLVASGALVPGMAARGGVHTGIKVSVMMPMHIGIHLLCTHTTFITQPHCPRL